MHIVSVTPGATAQRPPKRWRVRRQQQQPLREDHPHETADSGTTVIAFLILEPGEAPPPPPTATVPVGDISQAKQGSGSLFGRLFRGTKQPNMPKATTATTAHASAITAAKAHVAHDAAGVVNGGGEREEPGPADSWSGGGGNIFRLPAPTARSSRQPVVEPKPEPEPEPEPEVVVAAAAATVTGKAGSVEGHTVVGEGLVAPPSTVIVAGAQLLAMQQGDTERQLEREWANAARQARRAKAAAATQVAVEAAAFLEATTTARAPTAAAAIRASSATMSGTGGGGGGDDDDDDVDDDDARWAVRISQGDSYEEQHVRASTKVQALVRGRQGRERVLARAEACAMMPPPLSLAALVRGEYSLGARLEARGFPCVPSPSQPRPVSLEALVAAQASGADITAKCGPPAAAVQAATYFWGAYTVRRYGAAATMAPDLDPLPPAAVDGWAKRVAAVQLETAWEGVRDSPEAQRAFGVALCDATVELLERVKQFQPPNGGTRGRWWSGA